MKKVAIIGSGFAGYGAVIALLKLEDIEIHLFDIGLTSSLPSQPDIAIPNAKKSNGTYYPYGINDARSPIEFISERICSSHAFGGYSTVYSGSISYPKNSDLNEWPLASLPQSDDYQAILESMPTWHEHDALDAEFPMPPTSAALGTDPPSCDFNVLGCSRLATNQPAYDAPEKLGPFTTSDAIQKLIQEDRILYHPDCYVEKISISGKQTILHYQCATENFTKAFDTIFLGAGCVNTTGIVDRSLFGEGERKYSLHMTAGIILSFLRPRLRLPEPIRNRQLNNLPGFFLEINSCLTGRTWSHTQISSLNEQIVEAVCSRLPSFLHPVVRLCRRFFYFALCGAHSRFGPITTIRCSSSKKDNQTTLSHRIVVEELPCPPPPKEIHIGKAVRKAVAHNWRILGMIPIPFDQMLGDFFRRNQLGGWHFGGTLPMSDSPSTPTECFPSGEINGLPNVFIIDSAAFPAIPSSTIALLIATNAHRVARQSCSPQTQLNN